MDTNMIHVTMIVLQMYRVQGGGVVFYEKGSFAVDCYVNVYKNWYVSWYVIYKGCM